MRLILAFAHLQRMGEFPPSFSSPFAFPTTLLLLRPAFGAGGLSGDRSCKLHKRSLNITAENALSSV
ncbi:hypothetical protein DP180_19745 [Enterobacter kobei]|uniref:Uncharacterized protein n=1 Tax=Enterobacter kobei TaxID=208224 RepID=A0ABX9F7J3_9ENTR|nr:hypothetical protein D9T11_19210 [Enterobacter kobei]PYZ31298.1 hypothetical protein DNK77_03020 [Enterobacter cloacae complex sp.]RGD15598.1 hypothetical protein DW197_01730 [Enterobacter sp. AM17-18]KAA0533788.1 hypothetical protein F0324_00695 [Enterobacter kobei]PWR29694.1 hypothetical protein DK504_04100 [Enterobacter kobei]